MSQTRRFFTAATAAAGASLALGRSASGAAPRAERRDLFPQGVASGDPDAHSVILWTRRPPAPDSRGETLTVEVARDRGFRRIVTRAVAPVSEDADWTCRVLAAGLRPAREYWYRFVDEHGNASRTGRTLTAPSDNDERPIRFAFVSCQDPTQGALNAYRRMIFEDEARPPRERIGFVLHLGDFIYEVVWYPEDRPQGMYGRRLRDLIRYPDGERIRDFHVPASLADYRTAYRAYLQDPDLQDARARWPFVCVWDNHEFSWRGWQSQQVFGDETRPAQTKKVAANQAWFEYQPARVSMPDSASLDSFSPPPVDDAVIDAFDEYGLGLEPNNLAAVRSLKIYRALRWGRNVELIITDNHSYRSEPPNLDAFSPANFRWMNPQEAVEAMDSGRAHNDGRPPDTIAYGGAPAPNTRREMPPQSALGGEQKAWFLEKLRSSSARWKLWGHSAGTLPWRTDIQNLSTPLDPPWPGASYAMFNGGFFVECAEIFDLVRAEGVTGFAVVAGDKHSFWAGYLSSALPPVGFDPVGVEFATGSVSSPGLFEVAENVIAADDPLRALFLHDRSDGSVAPAMNLMMRAAETLRRTGDPQLALAQSNPEVAPHLRFADLGGHGYATVRIDAAMMETEFVCIPRPLERSRSQDGGPLSYRVLHRVSLWSPGERPRIEQDIVEGEPPLATRLE